MPPPRPLTKTPERDVLKAVTDLLSAHKIWWVRMNTGAISGVHNGKRRFFRFGRPGMADLMAWLYSGFTGGGRIIWIECKSPTGTQSEAQKQFQKEVQSEGHEYILARSVDDVITWFKEEGWVF